MLSRDLDDDRPIWSASVIRCTAHLRRGRPLIALVATDGTDFWLCTFPPRQKSDGAREPALDLGELDVEAGEPALEAGRSLLTVGHLMRIQARAPWSVIPLDPDELAAEPYPYVSVGCPQCRRDHRAISWILDSSAILNLVVSGEVEIDPRTVTAGGRGAPTPDTTLGMKGDTD